MLSLSYEIQKKSNRIWKILWLQCQFNLYYVSFNVLIRFYPSFLNSFVKLRFSLFHSSFFFFLLFQLEKQAKLNELDTVVILHLNQLQHISVSQTELKADLSQCLVFPKDGITVLQRRIRQLEEEKASQRKQQKLIHNPCVCVCVCVCVCAHARACMCACVCLLHMLCKKSSNGHSVTCAVLACQV